MQFHYNMDKEIVFKIKNKRFKMKKRILFSLAILSSLYAKEANVLSEFTVTSIALDAHNINIEDLLEKEDVNETTFRGGTEEEKNNYK